MTVHMPAAARAARRAASSAATVVDSGRVWRVYVPGRRRAVARTRTAGQAKHEAERRVGGVLRWTPDPDVRGCWHGRAFTVAEADVIAGVHERAGEPAPRLVILQEGDRP